MVSARVSGYPMIWWGMVSAVFVYTFLALFVLEPAGAVDPMVLYGLAAAGAAQAGIAQVMWAKARSADPPAAGASAPPWPVVAWALDEAPAVMGFILFMLGGPIALSLTLLGVSLAALLMNPYCALES